MSYKLDFYEDALKEWRKLDGTVREQFRSKLLERLENPRVPSAKLRDATDRYKIKLKSMGYRLVYEVVDREIVVVVVAIGKRERSAVYKAATKRP